MLSRRHYARTATGLLGLAAALVAGCAGLRCPRIDPSGERCLIWPKDQPAVPAVAPPQNPVAPPVLTDPYFPQVPAATATPAGAVVAPTSAAYPQPQDTLSITPARVLAPVGSEVVLKASICTTDGYTLADQKVEWMLGRNGVGQFVEVGGKGAFHPPIFPWNNGRKVDNYLATGYTSNGPHCITRGTADSSDDVNITRGDAWISVTSPNEGASHVTAYAPTVESWDQRKAVATIYWVDVQWTFPPPTVTSTGQGETLTTVVTRQSDGTPLAGWIVRYEVADAGMSESGVREVVTGPDGRAAAQVSPTASGAVSSQINIQLIRPAGLGGADAPRLVVANGTTIVNWSGGSTYLPPATSEPVTPVTPSVPPTTPSWPSQPSSGTPIPQLPAGQARLEVRVTGAEQSVVGGSAPVRITIRNVGDAPATNVVVADAFDPALLFPLKPTSDKIERSIGIIQAGQAFDEELPFQVNKAGRLCHQVTVTYAEGSSITAQHCVTATEPAPQREARLEVRLQTDGQQVRAVGDTAVFTVTVRNAGQTPLVNIESVEQYLPASVMQPIPEPGVEVVSNTVTRRIARLDVGQQQQFQTRVLLRQPASSVGPRVRATAGTDPPSNLVQNADELFLQVVPQGGGQGGPAQPQPQQPPAGSPLGVAISFLPSPARVGAIASANVVVRNRSSDVQEQVAVKVVFPPELAIDATRIEGPPNVRWQLDNNTVTFTPLTAVRPTETLLYKIPFSPRQAGVVSATAGVISRTFQQGQSETARLEVLSNTL